MGGSGYFGEASPPALLPPFHGEGGDYTCHILVNTMKFLLSILMEKGGKPKAGRGEAWPYPAGRSFNGPGAGNAFLAHTGGEW